MYDVRLLLEPCAIALAAQRTARQRERPASCIRSPAGTGSPRGAKRLVADALSTVAKLRSTAARGPVLLRADSAFYGHATVGAAITAGVQVSVTVRMNTTIKAAIAAIDDDAWQTIEYPDAVYDHDNGRWISRAEVAEVPFTAFAAQPKRRQVPGRLVVRRIPDLNGKAEAGQASLFDLWRFHAFFTTSDLDTVTADKTHRAHAVIEQVDADLKDSALAHLPSGRFAANAAWLVHAVMAFNLTRAAATPSGPALAKVTTGSIRAKLIAVPARIASSARRRVLHLPEAWPWQESWTRLYAATCAPLVTATT